MSVEILPIIAGGVLSALIATLLIFLGARYWKNVIVPWYEDRVYKDIKIDGEWLTRGKEEGKEFEEVALVMQNAHRVWGSITYKTQSSVTEYQFEGEFRNLILTARHSVKGKHQLERGTFTLMLRENGRLLKGFYAWYLSEKHDVVSGSYEWRRASSSVPQAEFVRA